ncbi:helicase-related protein [Mycolicibacterium vinylchloridicum]|uniref:helicase-related protein n=1 Tax=Mycolicibacterium vinylchloridicum TaxID=2736928 RepID=UPI001F2D494F
MISTDAGAEGQNLQFCNCVLNYDLPWNPMRIEQRIGRVDRLTQPKDEVFVANLYARGTIDESVYGLLAHKLRMFELLFGQVTTILGELDDSKTASFETRVMEALFAENDSKMQKLLNQLGTELVHAREKASELIAADSGMSQWMASAFDHREGLTKAGSTELAPEVSERARMRQRRVQTWVRNVLHALNAVIVHDTGDGDGAFLSAKFDEEFEQELGGRTLMHLAFDRFGLEHHPDAELCAVGSPVFDELLGLLRIRGDMHATVPMIPDDIGPSPYPHVPSIRLVRRRLIPSGSWSGQATFRTTIGEAETTEHLITADINGHNESRLPRRPLQDGESLPPSFGSAPKVISQFERAASSQLERLRRERSKIIEKEQDQELGRIARGYKAQIADSTGEERARLQRALRSEEARLSRRPDVRARAKILAVTLHEDDWVVEETWIGPGGDEATLTYEWGAKEPPIVKSVVSGNAIGVLALCSGTHWVDQSEVASCESCQRSLCQACGEDAAFAGCAVCGQLSCGQCRRDTGGLCRTCASPERAPEMDDEFSVAWKLNGNIIVRVGERVAELVRPASTSPEIVVAHQDIGNSQQARLRAYAKQEGLPLDCGLMSRNLTGHPEQSGGARARLYGSEKIDVELSIAPEANSSIDSDAASSVPQAPEVEVVSEDQFGLASLLKKLRSEVAPRPRPAVLVTRRSYFVDAYLEVDRIVREASYNTDDGSPRVTDVQTADIRWHSPASGESVVGVAELADIYVTLQRRNEAILVSARQRDAELGMWIACPEISSAAEQLGCYDFLCSLGMPGGRLGKRTGEVLQIVGDFPTPSECELYERDIRPVASLAELAADTDVVSADSASLTALGVVPNHVAAQNILELPNELAAALLDKTNRTFTSALCNGLEVSETWRGHGTARHTYQTFDGSPLPPRVGADGIRQSDFGVCRDGHFYAAGAAALCAACNSWACPACDEVGQQASVTCEGCSQPVCRRCASSTHHVTAAQCLLCADHACSNCGRDPQVAACATCERAMCTSCRVQDLCPACSQLAPISDDQRTFLPADLAVTGATVHAGIDNDAIVVVINRGRAYEQAIIRNGAIDRWIAFYRSHIDDTYRLRLAASRELQAQMIPTTDVLQPESPRTDARLVVRSTRLFRPIWSAPDLGAFGRSPEGEPSPDRDLTPAIRAQFPRLAYCPEPVLEPPRQLVSLMSSLDDPSTSRLSMRWERSGFDIAIIPSGISEITIDDSDEREVISEWQQNQVVVPWVADSWNPIPTVRKFASCGDTEAVIANMATLEALGVRCPDGISWYAITASKLAPAATVLSRQMGLGDADNVGIFTDPHRISMSAVTNAEATSSSVTPVGEVKTGPRSTEDSTREAFIAWAPNAAVTSPQLGVLAEELRLSLKKLRLRPAEWCTSRT